MERPRARVCARRLNPDDAAVRSPGANHSRDACEQSAAADRNHDRLHIRQVFEQFDSQAALPGDDRVVVIGGNEDLAGLRGAGFRRRDRLIEIAAFQHDRRAVAFGRLNLGDRRRPRHEDRANGPVLARRQRQPLRVIPRRRRNDTARLFVGRQRH